MNETHENRVKILAGAPDDSKATHFDSDLDYIHYYNCDVMVYVNHLSKWIAYGSVATPIRSLADIQKLVDMQNEIDDLKSVLRGIRLHQDVVHYLFEMDSQIEELIND